MADRDPAIVLELERGPEHVLRLTRRVHEGKRYTELRVFRRENQRYVETDRACSIRDTELTEVIGTLQRIQRRLDREAER